MKKMVLGVGNLLLSDEGFGIHVVRGLQEEEMPEDTEIFDGGTASWYALPSIEEVKKLIIIDAIKGEGKPGTIYILRNPNNLSPCSIHSLEGEACLPVRQGGRDKSLVLPFEGGGDRLGCCSPPGVSLHDIGLFQSLSWLASKPEEIVIFGMQPKQIDWGMELSEELKLKVPVVIELVREELERC